MNIKCWFCACTLALMSGCASLPSPASAAAPGLNVTVVNDSSASQSEIPVTFGQAFKEGDVPEGASVEASLADGTAVALQVDRKASHADGSLRHAVLTLELPRLGAHGSKVVALSRKLEDDHDKPVSRETLLATDFDTQVRLSLAGKTYTASARQALSSGPAKQWLSGPLASEWILSQPLRNSSGEAHPHLMAYFHVRAYAGTNGGVERARVDAIVENNWTFVPNPRDFTYDVTVTVGGQTAYTKDALRHYSRARWRKTFWWGESADVHVKPDTGYLIASRAVASYNQEPEHRPTEARLAGWANSLAEADTGPMGFGLIFPQFGGGPEGSIARNEAVDYLLTGDKRAFDALVSTGEAAGSFTVHYRDEGTGLVPSLTATPDITSMPLSRLRAGTHIPLSGTSNPGENPDASHQHDFAYIAYLATGDYYYLEELQFWANWNELKQNPEYRQYERGLFYRQQTRAQAWEMRTLGNVVYITPDEHPQKSYFRTLLQNNIEWYEANYVDGARDNFLHILTVNYAFPYNNHRAMPPWMDDYFTSAIGYLVGMGFSELQPLLRWKVEFALERMTNADFCWITATPYKLFVRDSQNSPLYTSWAKVYEESYTLNGLPCASQAMADALDRELNQMVGHPSTDGYPAIIQGALAAAVDAGVANAEKAWALHASRSVKPDYANDGNRWNIVPFQADPSQKLAVFDAADEAQRIAAPTGLCLENKDKVCFRRARERREQYRCHSPCPLQQRTL